jgi:ribonucleoside-diphosphate reductase alpha chain
MARMESRSGGESNPRATHWTSETLVRRGLRIPRRFTRPGIHPFDEVTWELRTATLTNETGAVLFEQAGVETPSFWSQMATNVVTSKYFNGALGTPERERSVKQLVGRVVGTIARWGREQGYFETEADADAFEAELAHLMIYQKAAFNSPVWFNVGVEENPQCSACFINSVDDTMESILTLAKTEGMLFKWGSGSGTNLSSIRSSKEALSGGGTASGPVSFMRGYDAFAGVIKSGGKTRRAAKMVILNIDHPDIVEYIRCKANEEKKAWTLIEAGYDGRLDGDAYSSIFFQNSNNSVRVTDEFMRAVEEDDLWATRSVTTGEVVEEIPARELFRQMADAAWICGDPGIQFHTTINDWHTCAATAPIRASNPCSEYMFLDDTACNLASLNLMQFRTPGGDLDVDALRHAVRIMILAQEILVDPASYPTERIEQNSHEFRPLGLGYANVGTFLMARGIPYDSEEGRHVAGAVTALMTGEAYAASAEIASAIGPFAGYSRNRETMLRVISKHRAAVAQIDPGLVPERLLAGARQAWEQAEDLGRIHGYRNSQVTVIAPTGTIAFLMDCDTTGVEPDIALIKYKKLVGGGMLKIVNQTVPEALEFLGYSPEERREILLHLEEEETIESAPHLRPEHLPIFDCAFRPRNGKRSIHHLGHIKMMAAVQPFISGAISKTVNMPNDATVEDIEGVYMQAWKLGLKAVAIYRDGCKRTQPLTTSRAPAKAEAAPKPDLAEEDLIAEAEEDLGTGFDVPESPRAILPSSAEPRLAAEGPVREPVRRRLPDERRSITHKFSIAGHEGYITVGLYDDGTPGEIFIVMAKQGSVVSGLIDCFATAISLSLQYGVPLKTLVDKFTSSRFEPSGITTNPEIRIAKSVTDYIFRWLALKFLPDHNAVRGSIKAPADAARSNGDRFEAPWELRAEIAEGYRPEADSPPCPECGSLMVRNASCYRCYNCGTSNGCS